MATEWTFSSKPVHASNISLVVREDQTEGQLIGNYSLQCAHAAASNGGVAWSRKPTSNPQHGVASMDVSERLLVFSACAMGSLSGVIPAGLVAGIGHKRILMLAPSTPLHGVRVVVDTHFSTGVQVPALRDIALYDWGGKVMSCV